MRAGDYRATLLWIAVMTTIIAISGVLQIASFIFR